MQGYLGEESLSSYVGTPFENFSAADWAVLYIGNYSPSNESHHLTWVLDQVVRILKGTPIRLSIARWDNGQEEYRYKTGEPSQDYLAWVASHAVEAYEHDEGIAP